MNHTKPGLDNALETLAIIDDYFAEFGWWPSVRDILERSKWKSTSAITYHLSILDELGYIEREKTAARAMRITDWGYETLREMRGYDDELGF